MALTVAGLLAQGAFCSQALAAGLPDGNVLGEKALGVNEVNGKVTNEQGEALPGVIVHCGNVNVQTDMNGEYHVSASKGDKLTFTYVGYVTATKTAVIGRG